jgi:methylglyoxal synthase
MMKKKKFLPCSHTTTVKNMIEWVSWNWQELAPHLICTGTTEVVEEKLMRFVRRRIFIRPTF